MKFLALTLLVGLLVVGSLCAVRGDFVYVGEVVVITIGEPSDPILYKGEQIALDSIHPIAQTIGVDQHWVVVMKVLHRLGGKADWRFVAFTVHSPSMSNLKVGKIVTVYMKKVKDGYIAVTAWWEFLVLTALGRRLNV